MSESALKPRAGVDDALTLLSNERRRLLVRFIVEEAGMVFDLGEVTGYITEFEHGDDYTGGERKAVYVGLYQVHLPEFVDAGVIEEVDGWGAHTYCPTERVRALYDVLEMATVRFGGDDE